MPTDPRFNDTRLGRTPTRKSLGKRVMSIFYRSEIGLPQDTIKSNTVVRIIVGLLLVHILIIAGVLVRDDLAHNYSTTAAESPTIDAPPPPALASRDNASADSAASAVNPPAATATHGNTRPISLSLEPTTPAPVAPATGTTESNTGTRITSISTPTTAPSVGSTDEDVAEDPAESSTARQNEVTAPASSDTPGRYLVKSGDTLSSIAREHGLRLDTLRRANPSLKGNTLIAGSYLVIPDKNGRVTATQPGSDNSSSEKTYTIKSGDTLGVVARKHGVSLQKLLDANNIAKKDANRIKIGQKIIIPE